MGTPIARLDDTATHGGPIITAASERSICEGRRIARVGDIYACIIHGPNPIVTGSPKFTCEGALVARGDGGPGSSLTACGALVISDAQRSTCE